MAAVADDDVGDQRQRVSQEQMRSKASPVDTCYDKEDLHSNTIIYLLYEQRQHCVCQINHHERHHHCQICMNSTSY